jgi:hypothetical protein
MERANQGLNVECSLASRREMLRRAGAGFGMFSLAGILGQSASSAEATTPDGSLGPAGLTADARPKHHRPRAKRVIFLFMNGAPSHVDTFDPKPALEKYAGQLPPNKRDGDKKADKKPDKKKEKEQEEKKKNQGFKPSPFRFRAHGQSGVVMSELFPHLARVADDLCVIRSMHTDVPNHEPGLLLMHSGHQQPVRPSLGSWVSYGLGTENANLPGYVVLCPGLPVVGPQLWSSAFLPGEFQGTSVNTNHRDVHQLVGNLRHPQLARGQQRQQLDLLQQLNALHAERRAPGDAALEAHIRSLELAFQMQRDAEEAFDLRQEPQAILDMYGDSVYSRSCLLARRLVERGVRFVQVYYITERDKQPWDTHDTNDQKHRKLCVDGDRATAALLVDLKQRGLLEDTLVVWGGEFGRTPYAQHHDDVTRLGRDHHHTGFSLVLAGGGVRGGMMYGATDELGMHAVENRVHVHDLHATMLHLLGIDHERLTYRYSGRDFRLTDVHGRIVHDILAG